MFEELEVSVPRFYISVYVNDDHERREEFVGLRSTGLVWIRLSVPLFLTRGALKVSYHEGEKDYICIDEIHLRQ